MRDFFDQISHHQEFVFITETWLKYGNYTALTEKNVPQFVGHAVFKKTVYSLDIAAFEAHMLRIGLTTYFYLAQSLITWPK